MEFGKTQDLFMKEMKLSLKISVIIPVCNCESYIGEAIDSVRGQGLQDYEILVVDDGSTDASAQIAENMGCVVLRKDGSLEPVAINALNSHILDQYKRKIIEFRNPDSYRRIFRKAK